MPLARAERDLIFSYVDTFLFSFLVRRRYPFIPLPLSTFPRLRLHIDDLLRTHSEIHIRSMRRQRWGLLYFFFFLFTDNKHGNFVSPQCTYPEYPGSLIKVFSIPLLSQHAHFSLQSNFQNIHVLRCARCATEAGPDATTHVRAFH